MGMQHPEYDSPFELTISDIATQMAKNIDEMSWKAIQRVGINVDKDKLLIALRQDAERYRKAYANGYETGYEKREDEIVLCKDCLHYVHDPTFARGHCTKDISCWVYHDEDWFCADGERKYE